MSNEMSQPKYLLENDEIIFSSLQIGSNNIPNSNLLTLWPMFMMRESLVWNTALGKEKYSQYAVIEYRCYNI